MRLGIICVVAIGAAGCTSTPESAKTTPSEPAINYTETLSSDIPVQALNIYALYKACLEGDEDIFKTVFSNRLQSEFEKMGWDTLFDVFVFNLQTKGGLGVLRLEDYRYTYEGDTSKGIVLTFCQYKAFPSWGVILEDNEWKIDSK